jgi:acyl-coenzyme A thioesterase PaaI-like protein
MTAARPSEIPAALATSDARREAAASLRELNTAFLSHEVGDRALSELAAGWRAATAGLVAAPPRTRSFDEIRREPEAADVPDGGELGHFDACFVTGEASPVGLAATVRRAGNGLVATLTFSRAFEGMPGHAHGGIVMAVFDDLIGMTMGRMLRISAPTVHVETDFRQPIPLDREVTVRTELGPADGRKRTVQATATVGDTVHAEARGLLIVLEGDRPFQKE